MNFENYCPGFFKGYHPQNVARAKQGVQLSLIKAIAKSGPKSCCSWWTSSYWSFSPEVRKEMQSGDPLWALLFRSS
jgi:hypothetical protein